MNKIKLILLINILFIFMPNIFAEEIQTNIIDFSCSPAVMKGTEIVCDIKIKNATSTIEAIQFNYEYNSKISYIKTIFNENCEELVSNSKGANAIINKIDEDNVTIAKINFIVSEEAVEKELLEIKLNKIELANGDETIFLDDIVKKVEIVSVKDVLNQLSVNGNNFEIENGVYNYNIDIDDKTEKVVIDAKVTNEKYEFLDDYGPRTINDIQTGTTEIILKVVSKENKLPVALYRVTINKKTKEVTDTNITPPEQIEEEKVEENPKTGNYYIITLIIIITSVVLIIKYKNIMGDIV